jgi:hypothetical protein
MTTAANRQTCVGSLPLTEQLCPALTVADVEDCSNAIGTEICAFEGRRSAPTTPPASTERCERRVTPAIQVADISISRLLGAA